MKNLGRVTSSMSRRLSKLNSSAVEAEPEFPTRTTKHKSKLKKRRKLQKLARRGSR